MLSSVRTQFATPKKIIGERLAHERVLRREFAEHADRLRALAGEDEGELGLARLHLDAVTRDKGAG